MIQRRNVRQLPNKGQVTARFCPGCGYEKPQLLVDMARLNFDCPRCGKHKLSEFLPIKGNA